MTAITGNGYQLIEGDCVEVMAGMDAGSVDAIVTDPPYGTTACKWDTIIPFDDMWAGIKHVRKPRAAVVLFGSEPFSSLLRVSNLKEYKYDWIWDKKLAGNFLNAKNMPLMIHEIISVFMDGAIHYNPQMTKGKYRKKAFSGYVSNGSRVYGGVNPYETYNDDYYPSTILEYSNADRASIHPTQKPVALMEYLIKTYTNEGDTVLDFTFGSCSTGVACLNTGRKFIGIEKDKDYFEIGKKRMEDREYQLMQLGIIPLSYDKIDKDKQGYQARSLFEHQQILEMGGYDEQE